jgi:putative phosphoribosyl transferase
LAKLLLKYKKENPLILAIPRGGVVTALPVCQALQAEFDLIVVRKLPIPWNPEAGFGAIALDGTTCFNPELYPFLGLSEEWVNSIITEVKKEIERRNEVYREGKPYPKVEGRIVIVVDDGLATGYTVLAAVESIKKHSPKKVVVATPVAQAHAAKLVSEACDEFVCLHVSPEPVFAVASFYREFPDLGDEEVRTCIRKAKKFSKQLKTFK